MSEVIGQSGSRKEVVGPPVPDVRVIAEKLGTCTLQEALQFVDRFGVDPRGCEPPAFLLAASNPDPAVVAVFLGRGINSENAPVYGRSCAYEYAQNNSRVLGILATHQIPLPTCNLFEQLPRLIVHDEVVAFAALFGKMNQYLKERALEILLSRDTRYSRDKRDYVIRSILDSDFDINMTQEKAVLQAPDNSALVYYQSNNYGPPLFRLAAHPELLVGRSADFNIRGPDGRTICHLLACGYDREHFDALMFVLDNGADPCAMSHSGRTTFQLCNGLMWRSKAALLFLAGCDIPSGELIGETAQTRCLANDIVHRTGIDICLALQALELPALVTCEILQARCAAWPRIPFHCFWNLAVAVKHFLAPVAQESKKRRV